MIILALLYWLNIVKLAVESIDIMKIAALSPFLTEIVNYFGLDQNLVCISHKCQPKQDLTEKNQKLPTIVTKAQAAMSALPSFISDSASSVIESRLSLYKLDLKALKSCAPDIILTTAKLDEQDCSLSQLRQAVHAELGSSVKLFSYDPTRLESIYEMYQHLGTVLNVARAGIELSGRLKAQFMDWSDNFYERTRGKKVSFINAFTPGAKFELSLSGKWIPDMVHLTSAVSQQRFAGEADAQVAWKDLVSFAPDVVVFAPVDQDLKFSVSMLSSFEKMPNWDQIPAVKRGEFVFCDGKIFFNTPGPKLLDSMGILISAIAGLESGYIADRDSFYRLRWVELHRHKF